MEKIRDPCKSGDSLMMASAVVAVEIKLPKFGTSAAAPLGMALEKRSHFAFLLLGHFEKLRFAQISY